MQEIQISNNFFSDFFREVQSYSDLKADNSMIPEVQRVFVRNDHHVLKHVEFPDSTIIKSKNTALPDLTIIKSENTLHFRT